MTNKIFKMKDEKENERTIYDKDCSSLDRGIDMLCIVGECISVH